MAQVAEAPRDVASSPQSGISQMRYGLEDRPGPAESFLFGVQHLLVMFTAMVASPLAVGQLLDLPPATRVTLITGCMLGSGIGTLVAAVGIGPIGPRLPIVMGIWTPFIVQVVTIGRTAGLGAVTTVLVTSALVVFAVSPLIGKLRRYFPPVVVGTVMIVAGVALMKIAVIIASGSHTSFFAKPLTLWFMVGSIVLIVIINQVGKGIVKLLSLFLALVCVYVISVPLGLANFQPVINAPWFELPSIAPYGFFHWTGSGFVGVLAIQFVAAIEAISLTLAVCEIVGVEGTEKHVFGAVSADSLCSAISAAFGGMPLVSYAQNAGAITLTRVGSRFVVAVGGIILIIMALMPKIGAILIIAPPFVIGGTLIFTFGMILTVGVDILTRCMRTHRDGIIVAASVGLSAIATFAPPQLMSAVPVSIRAFVGDGIVIGILAAFILNLALRPESAKLR